jgi:hypothetical protein
MINGRVNPPLPPECEKPGTDEPPARRRWIDKGRAQPSDAGNADDVKLRS